MTTQTGLGPSNDDIPAEEMELAQVVADNAAFDLATPEQRRVIIAKDVLKWLKIGKLKARAGTYMALYDHEGHGVRPTDTDVVNGYQCQACALGGVFAATVDRCVLGRPGENTGMVLGDGRHDPEKMRRTLAPYFDETQLRLIECSFERSVDFMQQSYYLSYPGDLRPETAAPVRAAAKFGRRYEDDRDRMEAIMKNIIANDGTFVP